MRTIFQIPNLQKYFKFQISNFKGRRCAPSHGLEARATGEASPRQQTWQSALQRQGALAGLLWDLMLRGTWDYRTTGLRTTESGIARRARNISWDFVGWDLGFFWDLGFWDLGFARRQYAAGGAYHE